MVNITRVWLTYEFSQIKIKQQSRMLMFLIFCLLTIYCIYLVHYYASKDVSWHVRLWSIITWVLNFGLALLVPEDVYITLIGQPNPSENRSLGLEYLVLYWLVYVLTWTVIPVLQEWEDAGDLESIDRLKRSLKINSYFYLVLLGISIVALLIIFFLGIGKDMGLIIFLKCLATMWGMLLLMILLGYSLVQIPKTMWRNSKPEVYLTYLYQKINEMQEEVQDAKKQFKQIAAYIGYVQKNTQDQDILLYCDASERQIPTNLKAIVKSNFEKVITATDYLKSYPISLESSIQHNRLIKRAIARCRRQQKELNYYVTQAVFYEDVKEAIETGKKLQSLAKRTNAIQDWWFCKARALVDKLLAILLGICSVILVISESQVFLTEQTSILGYLLLFENLQIIRISVFLVIAFIVYMANYALFRLKLANLYGLYYKESDGASLMFATVNFSRIGVAIVLNFFDMVKMENSIYEQVMQTPEMGLLGQWVLKGLPGVLWLIMICHFFSVWGWIAKKLGVDDSYSFSSHQIREQSGKKSSPVLVLQKRKELQNRKSSNLMQEMQTF